MNLVLDGTTTYRARDASPLEVLCVGTGRDGTTSIASMIQGLYDREGKTRRAMHEYNSRQLYGAYSDLKETGNEYYYNVIRNAISSCPYNAIIGNGYAAILPVFAELFPNLTLVHIRRGD